MIEIPDNGESSLKFIAKTLSDVCAEHQKSNLNHIQIISEQVIDALSEAYQQTKQLRVSLQRFKRKLQKLIYLYLLTKKSFQIDGFNSVVFFQGELLDRNLDLARFKSIKRTYEEIRYTNNLVAILPKLQSINYIEA